MHRPYSSAGVTQITVGLAVIHDQLFLTRSVVLNEWEEDFHTPPLEYLRVRPGFLPSEIFDWRGSPLEVNWVSGPSHDTVDMGISEETTRVY